MRSMMLQSILPSFASLSFQISLWEAGKADLPDAAMPLGFQVRDRVMAALPPGADGSGCTHC